MIDGDEKAKKRASRPLLSYAPDAPVPAEESAANNRVPADRLSQLENHLEAYEEPARSTLITFPHDDRKPQHEDRRMGVASEMEAVKAQLNAFLPHSELPPEPEPEPEPGPAPAPAPEPELEPEPVRRRSAKRLILTTTVLGGLLGAAYGLANPLTYVSRAELQVEPPARIAEIGSDAVLAAAAQRVDLTSTLDSADHFNNLIHGVESWIGGQAADTSPVALVRSRVGFVQSPEAGTVTVEAKTASAETSARLANAVAQAFQNHLSNGSSDTAQLEDGLPDRLTRLETDAVAAENLLLNFRKTRNFSVADGDQVAAAEQEFAASRAETERLSANADALRGASADSLAQNGVPNEFRGGLLGALATQYASAKQALTDLSVTLGPRHPQRIEQQKLVDGLRAQVDAELLKMRTAAQLDLKQAVEREQTAAQGVATLKTGLPSDADRARLRGLERDAATKRALYDDVALRAARGEAVTNTGAAASARLINPAVQAPTPSGFSLAQTIGTGLLGGLIVGVFLALLRRRKSVQPPVSVADSIPASADQPLDMPVEPPLVAGESRLGAAIREANARWEAENNIQPTRAGRISDVKRAIADVRSAMADYHRRNS